MGIVMRERKEPEFFKFSNAGDKIEGQLISVERTKVESGTANKYVMEKSSRERMSFLGSVKLDELLGREDIGHLVFVALTGRSELSGSRSMQNFAVSVSDREVRRVGDKFVECELASDAPAPDDVDFRVRA
jgi:hypothetical protein